MDCKKSYNPYKCPFMIHMDERFILILKGSCRPKWDAGLNSPESDHLNANYCLLTSTEGRIQGHVRATCGLLIPGRNCVQNCVLDGKTFPGNSRGPLILRSGRPQEGFLTCWLVAKQCTAHPISYSPRLRGPSSSIQLGIFFKEFLSKNSFLDDSSSSHDTSIKFQLVQQGFSMSRFQFPFFCFLNRVQLY